LVAGFKVKRFAMQVGSITKKKKNVRLGTEKETGVFVGGTLGTRLSAAKIKEMEAVVA